MRSHITTDSNVQDGRVLTVGRRVGHASFVVKCGVPKASASHGFAFSLWDAVPVGVTKCAGMGYINVPGAERGRPDTRREGRCRCPA